MHVLFDRVGGENATEAACTHDPINLTVFIMFLGIFRFTMRGTLRLIPRASCDAVRNGGNMWISKRTDYAARAVLALTLAESQLTLDELTDRTAVPRSVLEQVMPQLRSDGIVRSERGRNGGYRMNRPADQVTLEDIVRLFQGPLAPIGCATRRNPEPCEVREGCSMHDVWAEVREATIRVLKAATFAKLAEDASGVWTDPGSHLPIATV